MSRAKRISLILTLLVGTSLLIHHSLSNLMENIYKHILFVGNGFTGAIPEPIIMFLLGFSLIGIGVYTRRRFGKKAS